MATPATPQHLAPPGAGLPAIELAWVRPVFAFVRLCFSNAWATARFRREAAWMVEQVDALPPERAIRPVLVKRVVGIEDSSRGWSACMVLEHLRIVDRDIIEIIEALGRGRALAREIRTADMKPRVGVDRTVLGEFTVVLNDYGARVNPALARRSRAKHAHPWFGPLDAHGWHCLAAIHHTLHRRQLAAILRGLARGA